MPRNLLLILTLTFLACSAKAEQVVADAQGVKPVERSPIVTPTAPEPATVVSQEPLAPLDFSVFESIAIQDGGRKKPLQTYAVEFLEQITGRAVFASQPYYDDPHHLADPAASKEKKQRMGPVDVLLSMTLNTRDWLKEPVLLVAYGPLKKELGLDVERKRFSLDELRQNGKMWDLIKSGQEKQRAGKVGELTSLEQESLIVAQRVSLMQKVLNGSLQEIIPHPSESTGTWISIITLVQLFSEPDQAIHELAQDRFDGNEKQARAVLAPYAQKYTSTQAENIRVTFRDMVQAYMDRKPAEFLAGSQSFKGALAALSPTVYPADEALKREIAYNNMRPFGKAWLLYLGAAILGLFLLKTDSRALRALVWGLALSGFALHVYGFISRCMIAGRPPVSNMYESVIWVGFGAVLFGLIFELIFKARYFIVSGMGGGFLCLVLMDQIPVWTGNSSMKGFEARIDPLVPVLRDNFWLTVHVLTITLSYAAFALAWVLGHITLFQHIASPARNKQHFERHQYIYRILQVGVLLLATGTILGGVWAYYSWGRFWGWDSKETWAFIALLCYLVVLHGRFTGWWSDFAFAVGSVVCFQAVVMAWYGVNFILGSGLHAYGAGSADNTYIYSALAADLVFTIVAVMQHRMNGSPEEVAEA